MTVLNNVNRVVVGLANRRMFSLDVIDTDKFLDMPISAQCLYFHLGMRADDDGFVSSPKQIIRMTTCTQGDIKTLAENGFIIPFQSGIVVITHWRQNNYVRCDRYTKSVHTEEMKSLILDNGIYSVGMTNGIPTVIPLGDTDKIRLDKIRQDKTIVCSELETAPSPSGILIPLNDKSFYDVPGDRIALWKETYLAVDVEQELKKMVAWSHSNPTKRKTRRGVERFINSWLAREQDKGGNKPERQQAPALNHEFELPEYYKLLEGRQPSPDDPFQ